MFEENKKFVELYNKHYNDNNLITRIVMNALQLDEYLASVVVDNYKMCDRYTLILKYTLQKLGKYKETINNYLIDTNNYIWLYIEDDKYKYYSDIDYKYKKVAFYGPVQIINGYWLAYSRYKHIKFNGLNLLQSVGKRWLIYCKNLISIDFNGLINLESIGNEWINECINLKHINFSLNNLKNVGNEWLNNCYRIEKIKFCNLENLRYIGNNWLNNCFNLSHVIFDGFIRIDYIGYNWLNNCNKLDKIEYSGLQKK